MVPTSPRDPSIPISCSGSISTDGEVCTSMTGLSWDPHVLPFSELFLLSPKVPLFWPHDFGLNWGWPVWAAFIPAEPQLFCLCCCSKHILPLYTQGLIKKCFISAMSHSPNLTFCQCWNHIALVKLILLIVMQTFFSVTYFPAPAGICCIFSGVTYYSFCPGWNRMKRKTDNKVENTKQSSKVTSIAKSENYLLKLSLQISMLP